ncbi:MAG: InlB B-repeat-containing protein [Clostridia bacterium]|nr:InlB B-repeat-containing protein [Clostridia bacterium]
MKRALLKTVSLVAVLALLMSAFATCAFSASAVTVKPTTLVRQDLAKWKNYVYGDSQGTLYRTGCGMFAIVNAVGYLTGNTMSVTEVASWGHSIGGYNPGNTHAGTYRMTIYPRLQAKYGERYGFTVDCGSTNEGYWAGSSSSTLKNHLKNGGVAIGHVPGHFIAVVGYDPNTNYYHVYDSYPTSARGTGNGDAWVTQSHLATGKLKLDWFCLLSSTGTVINNQVMQKNYTVTFDPRGGSSISPQKVQEGALATNPGAPTREGFNFVGWYDENGYPFTFDTTAIWANRSLHAVWEAISYPQTTEYMPTRENTVVEEYTDGGDSYIWPYYNPYSGSATFYKGGADHGWPTVLTTYKTSVDLSKTGYFNLSIVATARFNAAIQFRDANFELHTVKLSQVVNGNDDDFEVGQYVIRANLGYYLYSCGLSMPADGVVNIETIRFYTIGYTDEYVTINAACFTGDQHHTNTMLGETLTQHATAGATGEYIYENGVLMVDGTAGYNVSFYPNVAIDPEVVKYWLVALSSDANFDISMIVTTTDGDKRVSLASDYYHQLGHDTYPELGLAAGQYTRAFDLLSMYQWHNNLPADGWSTVKEVTVELRSTGRLVLRANQVSNAPVPVYYEDTMVKSESWVGHIDITNDRYTLDDTTDVLFTNVVNATVSATKSNLNNNEYVTLFDGDNQAADTATAKTGLTVKVMNGSTLLKQYTLAVRGDVDCDGAANSTDVRAILAEKTQNVSAFSVAQEAAGDLDGDTQLTTSDARMLILELAY